MNCRIFVLFVKDGNAVAETLRTNKHTISVFRSIYIIIWNVEEHAEITDTLHRMVVYKQIEAYLEEKGEKCD